MGKNKPIKSHCELGRNKEMNKTIIYHLIVLICVTTTVFGQNVSKVGTTAAAFLEIEVGARAVGMGGAFMAVANDATTIYWNPAGLARLPGGEAVLCHNQWLAGINFDFAGVVLPLSQFGALGVSITSFTTDEMDVRTVIEPEGTGEKFSVNDLSLGLSYAKSLTDRFSIGFTVKYIQQNIWHMKASSFAIDIGTLFTTPFYGIRIGMCISNFGSKMRMEGKDTFVNYDIAPQQSGSNDRIPAYLQTDEFALPLLFRVGLAMDVLKSEDNLLTLAVDAAHPSNNTEYVNLGMEYVFKNLVALRVGYKNLFLLDNEEGFTAGAGLKLNKMISNVSLMIDYSYQDFGRLSNAQRFSLGLAF